MKPIPGAVYEVGGAVRDALLGRPVTDRDYVVVGSTPQAMLAAGFKPVGADFPVFLHPETHAEYALARTERKTAPGYRGFVVHSAPEVTLEDDLRRRDLTINAMARDSAGALIDPYGGAADLAAHVLRHVSEAFAEDPVRILRTARFAARFGFQVAPETQALMQRMVAAGEVDALVPERVWQELARGLMEKSPSRLLEVLTGCGALARLLPEADLSCLTQANRLLDHAAARGERLPVRFGVLAVAFAIPAEALVRLSTRLRVPAECRDLARLATCEWAELQRADTLGADPLIDLLQRADAFRRPARFEDLLRVLACVQQDAAQAAAVVRLRVAHTAASAVDAGAIAAQAAGKAVGAAVRAARVEAVTRR
jgi:tRNA nucleotidyltransferase (CCA-adding enzyme)